MLFMTSKEIRLLNWGQGVAEDPADEEARGIVVRIPDCLFHWYRFPELPTPIKKLVLTPLLPYQKSQRPRIVSPLLPEFAVEESQLKLIPSRMLRAALMPNSKCSAFVSWWEGIIEGSKDVLVPPFQGMSLKIFVRKAIINTFPKLKRHPQRRYRHCFPRCLTLQRPRQNPHK